MSKTSCAQLLREVIGEGTVFESWHGGDLYECGVPGEGEEFANAPAGHSKEETQCACTTYCKSIHMPSWSHGLSGDFDN